MRKKTRKKKQKNLLQKLSASRGSVTFKLILAVIIIGSVAFVSGAFPTTQLTPQDPDAPRYRPNIDDDIGNRDSLQLRTIGFEACSSVAAVSLLVDVSGSMKYVDNSRGTTKLDELKKALNLFTSKMTDESLVGLATYSVVFREVVGIQPYLNVKNTIGNEINKLQWHTATYTRRAFEEMVPILQNAVNRYPDKNFTLIFASDGIPESQETLDRCSSNPNSTECQTNCKDPGTTSMRCFATDQDPTISPNIAQQIKDMGVTIYSIAILDNQDSRFNTQLTNLLRSVASPDSFYVAPTSDELSSIYDQIGFEMCEKISS